MDPSRGFGKLLVQLLKARRDELAAAFDQVDRSERAGLTALTGATAGAPNRGSSAPVSSGATAVNGGQIDADSASAGGVSREGSGVAAKGADVWALLAAAYPEAAEVVGRAVEGLEGGRVRLWLVPFAAFNPAGGPPQVSGGWGSGFRCYAFWASGCRFPSSRT